MPNRLINARSPYLKKAAEQPVDWFEWGEEAFEKAKAEDKPIFLSIGGVWCHWCHVMAHETFEDKGIAQLINENFVPIKVDRDERPDIDRRYQDVVLRISGSGGWPLTAFLTAEGRVFFGGTYFPPEDAVGRVGLKTILQKLLELYHGDRNRIETVAEELYQQSLSAASSSMVATLDRDLTEKALSAFLSSVDLQNGGMGRAPKFHHASAFEFLLCHDHFKKNELVTKAIEISLDAMAKGGVYDHLLGGFFRYSTDEKWIVPHFEKMLHDNAELLRLYSISYKVFRKDRYRYVAEGIVDYYRKYGLDEKGGFYASQDADIGVLDEGGYYCFSLPETRALLTEDEFNVISLHYDIMPEGEMHHDPSKNVLFIAKEAEEIAKILGTPLGNVEGLIRSARGKLLAYREGEREMPYVDKTVYANWNGLMIEAMCVAGNLFDKKEYIEMAERAAKRIIADFYREGRLQHREGVDGFSEDYLFFSKGLLALYEATQDREYLARAKNLMDTAIELFWDKTNWGFFDNAGAGPGYLTITVKNIQDTPGQSANGAAPHVLQLLAMLTRDTTYTKYAEKTLSAFASLMAEYPTASASYFLSLAAFERGIYLVETSAFLEEALRDFRPFKFVVRSDIEGVMVCEKDRCNIYKKYEPAS